MKVKVICNLHNDIQLLPHFLKHYKELGIKDFILGIWRGEKNPIWEMIKSLNDETITLIKSYDQQLDGVSETVFWNFVIENHVGQDDWYIVADLDEFHVMLNHPNVYSFIECVKTDGCDHVSGLLIDRTTEDGSIPPTITDKSIWEQFPKNSYLTQTLLKANIHKIFVAHQHTRISPGHHWIDNGVKEYGLKSSCYHFKWFGNLLEKEEKKLVHYKKLCFDYWGENMILVNQLKNNNGKLF